ncbi:MAG TPA: hypothetical protein PKD55_02570 [Bellilinea sp.]|nr:hypothetical protein [Bellilinea sp.]
MKLYIDRYLIRHLGDGKNTYCGGSTDGLTLIKEINEPPNGTLCFGCAATYHKSIGEEVDVSAP